MKGLLGVLLVLGGMGYAAAGGANSWAVHQTPHWERALLRGPVLQINGQRYYVHQQLSRLLLSDFYHEQAPDWVKRAHHQPLPTGVLLSGQTERMRWWLKVVAMPGGTQWNWSGQRLHDSMVAVQRLPWIPRVGQIMLSSQEQHAGWSVIQQSYRFNETLEKIQEDLHNRLQAAGWQLEHTAPQHDRWVKAKGELDLLYQRIAGYSGVYLVLREVATSR